MESAQGRRAMRCPKLVSDDVTYRQCVLDAGHTIACLMQPDWMEQERDALAAEIAQMRAARKLVPKILKPWTSGNISFREWCEAVDAYLAAAAAAAPSRDPVSPQEQCPKCGNMAHSDSPFNVCIQAAAPPVEE